MIKVALCDDEKIQLHFFEEYLSRLTKLYPSLEWDTYYSGEELLKGCCSSFYDIIFLDIEMSGNNGIATAKALRANNENSIIIFVTNYRQYVYESFEALPFRFVEKPVSFEAFSEIFRLAYIRIQKISRPVSIGVGSKYNRVNIYPEKVIYCESAQRKVFIHTVNGSYDYYGKLSDFNEKLKNDNFVFSHKSYLLNIAYVSEINCSKVKLSNGELVPMSDSKRQEVLEKCLMYTEGMHLA